MKKEFLKIFGIFSTVAMVIMLEIMIYCKVRDVSELMSTLVVAIGSIMVALIALSKKNSTLRYITFSTYRYMFVNVLITILLVPFLANMILFMCNKSGEYVSAGDAAASLVAMIIAAVICMINGLWIFITIRQKG